MPSASHARSSPPEALTVEAVYREHVRFVWRCLARLGIAPEEIEDAAHEVFLVVHRRLPDFDGRAPLRSWLYGIARGVASNRRRARARETARMRLFAGEQTRRDPDEPVRRREARALVDTFLQTLSPKLRVVFELSEIEGLRGPEVAAALQLNLNTVYTRVRTVRQQFEAYVGRLHALDPKEASAS
jgi:RNA polymerase sigma-70 factor, ECF subfamily